MLICCSCTYVQIEKDFELLFPGKSNMLFERWTQLSLKVLELVRKTVKDASVQRLLKLLEGTNDNGVLSTHYNQFTSFSICCDASEEKPSRKAVLSVEFRGLIAFGYSPCFLSRSC